LERQPRASNLAVNVADDVAVHQWDEALKACSAIQTLTFERERFVVEYERRKSADNTLGVRASDSTQAEK
jgi:hypothetical protein